MRVKMMFLGSPILLKSIPDSCKKGRYLAQGAGEMYFILNLPNRSLRQKGVLNKRGKVAEVVVAGQQHHFL